MNNIRPVIFLAFANNKKIPQAYLHMLGREATSIYDNLFLHHKKERIELLRIEGAEVKDIFKAFTQFRNRISIFHYGGHASGDALVLEDAEGGKEIAGAEGLASFLGKQKNLRLVFLNGCSTLGQVELLLESGVKAVIATSTAINDQMAVEFAEQFYLSLANDVSIHQAFNEAKSFIDTKFHETSPKIEVVRDFVTKNFYKDGPMDSMPWGLYFRDGSSEEDESWKLPRIRLPLSELINQNRHIKKKAYVNDYLILPVFKVLQDTLDDLEMPIDIDGDPDELKIQDKIIESYPSPIGEQLRKLFANSQEMANIGLPRLSQLIRCYEIISKLLAFTALSDLWELMIKQEEISVQSDSLVYFNSFFAINAENYKTYNYLRLLNAALRVLNDNNATPFISELYKLKVSIEKEDELHEASEYLEEVRAALSQNRVLATNMEEYCTQGEFHLSELLKKCAFLIKYRLVTVKDIAVNKLRHKDPSFALEIGVLRGTDARRIRTKSRRYDQFTDSHSVLLVKNIQKIGKNLSLSPFIIDENALSGYPNIKVFFFNYSEKGKKYHFEFVDTQTDTISADENHFSTIKDQFDAFKKSLG